jgi:amino acid transporter
VSELPVPSVLPSATDIAPPTEGAGAGATLKRSLGTRQLFALGFGGIVGAGWVIALGSWLDQAGPVGAIAAFSLGGLIVSLIGVCYAEMMTTLPRSGGEVVYAYELFGSRACFAIGWLLTLAYIATTIFEALSVAWLIGALFPVSAGPELYHVWGSPVAAGDLVLALGGMALITYVNYRGLEPAAAVQDLFTYLKILIAAVFIVAGLVGGKAANLVPLVRVSPSGSAWAGIAAVMTTAPFWFGGFNTIAQVMEEKAPRTSLRMAGRTVVGSIIAAATFYCLIILAAAMVVPWRQLVGVELPAAAAFRTAFGSTLLANLVLVAALFGILTVWNGVAIAASRVLYALGRAQLLPGVFARLHPRSGSPTMAIAFVGLISALGILLGRRAIGPVVNVASTCFAVSYVLVCVGVIRLRRTQPALERPYRVPGGIVTAVAAAAAAVGMTVLSLQGPMVAAGGRIPLEWWALAVWIVVGALVWAATGSTRRRVTEQERRALVAGDLSRRQG